MKQSSLSISTPFIVGSSFELLCTHTVNGVTKIPINTTISATLKEKRGTIIHTFQASEIMVNFETGLIVLSVDKAITINWVACISELSIFFVNAEGISYVSDKIRIDIERT